MFQTTMHLSNTKRFLIFFIESNLKSNINCMIVQINIVDLKLRLTEVAYL